MTSNPFDRPHRAEPESPDELLAMIQFEGTPALQGVLRSLRREFIDIFSTAVRPLPARVKPMVIEVDGKKVHQSGLNKTAVFLRPWYRF